MNYISSNLRFLRKLAGLSQEQFAKRVAMNRGNIASYEKGNAEPNIAKLQRIVEYFNVDLVAFIQVDLSQQITPKTEEETHAHSSLLHSTNRTGRNAAQNAAPLPLQEVLLPNALQGLQSMQLYQWQASEKLSANVHQIEQNLQQLNQTLTSMLDVQKELLVQIKNNELINKSVEIM